MDQEIDAKHIDALHDLEDDFEDAEVELLRYQHKITKDLFAKRKEAIAKIPNFWALAFEQAPAEIDEYIHPNDAQVLAQALESVNVERFELPDGDPRSISITFEFRENEFFTNKTLTKKFWWRYSKDTWAGHVSEPVKIDWKEGKDLTDGMLDLVCKIWEEEKAGKTLAEDAEPKKTLISKMDKAGIEGVSFFGWFGFRGRNVSEQESKEAYKIEQDKRARRKAGEEVDDDEDDDEDEDEYETEIFPVADDVAVCFAEDFFPNAIRYFTSALDDDNMSEMDFEDDEDAEMEEADGDEQPSKKRKA